MISASRSVPFRLTGATYHACFGEILAALPAAWAEGLDWTSSQQEWRAKLIEGMAIWHSVLRNWGGVELKGRTRSISRAACGMVRSRVREGKYAPAQRARPLLGTRYVAANP